LVLDPTPRRAGVAAALGAFLVAACAALVLVPSALHALEIPEKPSARVNDYASLLPGDVRGRLEERLARFESETTTQIVVAIFPSLEGESLEDYVNRLYERWRLGQKGQDNGVLLAIFLEDRKARIEVGYGLEGALTDALASRILRERLIPEFREKRYAEGIEQAVIAIEAATRGEYKSPERKKGGGEGIGSVLFAAFWIAMILSIVIGRLQARGAEVLSGSGSRRYRGRPWADPTLRGRPWWAGTFDGGGGGGGWSGGGGGGGFSGGGGSSGGGGASGSW
jgi:uncharacterized protein